MALLFIYSLNTIGQTMAGPAIRCYEMAKALCLNHQVYLIAPNQTNLEGEGFKILVQNSAEYHQRFPTVDVILTQNLNCFLAFKAKRYGIKIIIDAYTPVPLERFEQFGKDNFTIRQQQHDLSINNLLLGFQLADFIICASEKQRDLWIGFLLAHNLFGPQEYHLDPSLRHLIDVVPFGLSSMQPQKNGPGLRERYGFRNTDFLIVWGGGIWNWFDPLSLIESMKLLKNSHPQIKLIFLGIKNPDPTVPEMAMASQAVELAKSLELFNVSVFFNQGWIPYEERHNYLLDASVGVSTHFNHLETRFSFRTRMLDYLWTNLPIVATKGDIFAEFIEKKHLGITVPYQNPEAIKNAFIFLFENPNELAAMRLNVKSFANEFVWDQTVAPLNQAITRLSQQPKKNLSFAIIWNLITYTVKQIQNKGLSQTWQAIIRRMK